ncbi:MAG: thymidine phosphorylase [Actinomycetota bacterium]|nr:thymidine phosphorylase [Actinomycetota bacterium]
MRPAELIQRKRDGEELAPDELRDFVVAFVRDDVPDYQMAAFCMAVFFRGLSARETHALTDAMVASGETIDLSPLGRRVVDKHSTGGVGDKASLVIGPVVAACGVPFAKMSGRGLGHTGGTLDKLESIPGMRIELAHEDFLRQVAEVGMAIIGQTGDLVPADKRLYALRDVTATVDNVSLIASSIMSKKIAAGADAIVLDVKVGDGAFMKTLGAARELAQAMVDLGREAGRDVVCELTDMDQPLGYAVGNALEVREAVETLGGQGPRDLGELVLSAAGHLLALSDLGVDAHEGRLRAEEAIATGRALEAYERWIAAQGGEPSVRALPTAPVVRDAPAPESGFVQRIATTNVGLASLRLGAGRTTKDDVIDHAVGLVCRAKRGDRVERGDPLATIHAGDETAAHRAAAEIQACYTIGPEEPESRPIVLDVRL